MKTYRYTFSSPYDEIPTQKPLLDFANRIQREVGLLGGRVVRTWLEGGKYKTAFCTVQFSELDEIQNYVRWYYEADFTPEEVQREIDLIEEGDGIY